jgi:hypothetical protein
MDQAEMTSVKVYRYRDDLNLYQAFQSSQHAQPPFIPSGRFSTPDPIWFSHDYPRQKTHSENQMKRTFIRNNGMISKALITWTFEQHDILTTCCLVSPKSEVDIAILVGIWHPNQANQGYDHKDKRKRRIPDDIVQDICNRSLRIHLNSYDKP